MRPRSSSAAREETKVARLTRELKEALDRQRATAEVLSAISRSKLELQSILQSVVDTASQLCRADVSVIFRLEGGVYRFAAGYSLDPVYLEHERRTPISPGPGTVVGRAAMSREVVQIEDAWTDPLYEQKPAVKISGGRSMIGVPLMRDGEPIGVIGLARTRVEPFTQREIELVTTFADQAVIAIENTRLFEAEHQRTRELSESLEQQTATSQILQVISGSPGELQPVFQTILENATRICEAKFGVLALYQNDLFRITGTYNVPAAYADYRQREPAVINVAPRTSLLRLAATKKVIHISDYAQEEPNALPVKLGGARTLVAVPMLKDDELVGAIVIYRQEVRPFTDKQIELVSNFAAQAVIAIENTRLLNELRQRTGDLTERTDDLTEALEQQTATSEVLQIISSSPGDLEPVFATMLENAVRICAARFGGIYRIEGDTVRLVATHDVPAAYAGARRFAPFRPGPKHPFGRMMAARTVLHVVDAAAEQGYVERRPEYVAAVELGGIGTYMTVPMLKENEPIGAFLLARQEVHPFTEKQIALVASFAAQAVIAIENTRLLNELRQRTDDLSQRTADLTESLQQQTATSDVLKVISRSTFDLPKVLNTLLESAARLCEADKGQILRPTDKDGSYYSAASYRHTPEYEEHVKTRPLAPGRSSVTGRVLLEGKSIQIADVLADPEYKQQKIASVGDFRTILGVPLLREGIPIGLFLLQRAAVRPFTDKQVKLVETFADQAVIAIENVRLFEAEQQRTRELTESLEQQTATSEVLQVISSSPGDLEPVFATMLEKAVRICDAKFGNLWLREGDFLRIGATHGAPSAWSEFLRRDPVVRIDPRLGTARAIAAKQPYQVADVAAEPTYGDKVRIATIELARARSLIGVPLLRDDEVIGFIVIYRQEVRPFTDKQIEVVQNFAAQAVIAIENARLLNELRESLRLLNELT